MISSNGARINKESHKCCVIRIFVVCCDGWGPDTVICVECLKEGSFLQKNLLFLPKSLFSLYNKIFTLPAEGCMDHLATTKNRMSSVCLILSYLYIFPQRSTGQVSSAVCSSGQLPQAPFGSSWVYQWHHRGQICKNQTCEFRGRLVSSCLFSEFLLVPSLSLHCSLRWV